MNMSFSYKICYFQIMSKIRFWMFTYMIIYQEQNKALRLKDDIFTSIQEDVASESLDKNEIDDESQNKSQR